jgi:hypothetical protein
MQWSSYIGPVSKAGSAAHMNLVIAYPFDQVDVRKPSLDVPLVNPGSSANCIPHKHVLLVIPARVGKGCSRE